MAGLNGDFPNVGNFYCSEIRNNGTARRVTEAMVRMGGKDFGFERYSRPPGCKLKKHDLHIFIDDGMDAIQWLPPAPNACWLIDTHLGYDTRFKWASHFDHAFLAQKADVTRMRGEGLKNVHWLPLACSPYLDPNYKELKANLKEEMDLTRAYDCVFVGFLNRGVDGDENSHSRVDFLDSVFKEFPNSWLSFNLFFLDAAIRYVRGKVGLNISIKNDLNMRFFEAMSYGVCELANEDQNGWKDLGFEDGKHFLSYGSIEEAKEKVRWALDNPDEREAIAKAGMEKVRAEHTYEHRIEQMLDVIGV
jgi:hypothetical protein